MKSITLPIGFVVSILLITSPLNYAFSQDQLPSKYGPYSTKVSPKEENTSPQVFKTNQEPKSQGDFVKGRILIKIKKPDTGKITPQIVRPLSETLSVFGISNVKQLFPTAKPPLPGETIRSPLGVDIPKPDLTLWYIGELMDENADVQQIAEEIKKNPEIEHAEPDYVRKIFTENKNPLQTGRKTLSSPLSVSDQRFNEQWYIPATRVNEAWTHLASKGLPSGVDTNIVVAFIDTGVYLVAGMWRRERKTHRVFNERIMIATEKVACAHETSCKYFRKTAPNEDEATLISFIMRFQTYQQERNPEAVLNLFSPPQNVDEERQFDLLYMKDVNIYRLYSAAELTFRLKSWSIREIVDVGPQLYRIEIVEIRNSWNNITGKWGYDTERVLLMTVGKNGNEWKIQSYCYKDDKCEKYSGFFMY